MSDTNVPNNEIGISDLLDKVKELFSKLQNEINITVFFGSDNNKNEKINEFIQSFSNLTPKVSLKLINEGKDDLLVNKMAVDLFPCISVTDKSYSITGIKFCGIPTGHEFNSFVYSICNIGGVYDENDSEILKRIEKIKEKTDLKILISLSCHLCPEVVISSQKIAALNSNVSAAMIDISMFPKLRKEYKIMSVPALVVNEKLKAFGTQSVESILDIIEKGE